MGYCQILIFGEIDSTVNLHFDLFALIDIRIAVMIFALSVNEKTISFVTIAKQDFLFANKHERRRRSKQT